MTLKLVTAPTALQFVGATGGAGTTTAACFAAVRLAQTRKTALVGDPTAFDSVLAGANQSTRATSSDPGDQALAWGDRLDFVHPGGDLSRFDVIVKDAGTLDRNDGLDLEAATYVVLRGPSYQGMRAISSGVDDLQNLAGVVLFTEEGRALSSRDLLAIVGRTDLDVIEIRVTPGVARSIDAGMFVDRAMYSLTGLEPVVDGTLRSLRV